MLNLITNCKHNALTYNMYILIKDNELLCHSSSLISGDICSPPIIIVLMIYVTCDNILRMDKI